ncbi:MAG: amidohydrolase, partial [Bacteroidetes bacterium]|nr:amidohydrolase [Bacteroidota bacterium]
MKTNFLILFTLLSLSSFAQNKKKADDKNKDWKVADLHGPAKDVSFETDEGTWMNVDVSPDGKQIVFDLLGDIYIMPLNGGEAKILCEGTPFEVQPRFSPDGKMISYTSDRDGGDNIWVMNVDGTNPHAISKESFRLCNNAVWMPDGLSLVAKKHFTAGRSLGSGEMWQYHISGGSGLELTKKKNEQQDVGEPCVSHDGRYVFWSEDMTEGPYFKYNKDPNPGIYVIRRLDTKTGKIEDIIGGAGGACRPQISPDDKLMAFVKRVRLQSVLYIHDLTTGEEWPIYTDLSRDQQETWATFGVYTGFNWTPDGKNIIIWAKGKIRKIDVQKKTAEVIPFKVKVHQIITEAVKFPQEVAPKTFEAKMLRDVVTSPNGNAIVFNAAGHIYLKKLPNGTPERLTKNEFLEYFPSFSADGKNVVYVGWNDSDLAAIYTTAAMVGGTPTIKKITTEKGFYYSPSFSKDGSKILFYKGGGDGILGNAFSLNQGIYWMDAKGGKMNFITDEGSNPQWSADGKSVYYSAGKTLKTIDLESKEIHALYSSQYGKDFTVSPNGKYIAWTELFNAYIAPFNTTGSVIDLSAGTTSFPNYKLTRDAGTCIHW